MNLDTASKSYIIGAYDLCQFAYFSVEEIPDDWQKKDQSDIMISIREGERLPCRLYATTIKNILGLYKATGVNKFTATRRTDGTGKGVIFASKK